MESVGFIGIGIMGRGMVQNLIGKDYDVRVFARDAQRAAAFAQAHGVLVEPSLRHLAQAAGTIVLCVTDTKDVEQIAGAEGGLLDSMKPGGLVIDCSTISPAAAREIGGKFASRSIGFVDAPVSGGSEGAERGTLSIMAGGSDDDFQRARPYLEAMGTRITHMGPVGTGQSTKLLNQILVVVNMLAVSEALLFGKAAQLNLEQAIRAVEHGAAGSWMLSNRGTQALNDYWAPGFTIDLQQKDLRLVLDMARDLGVPLLATGMVHQLYSTLQSEGKGALGNHALIQAIEKLSGLRVCPAGAAS